MPRKKTQDPGDKTFSWVVPIFSNGAVFANYWLPNLFSKWGNGDGDDSNLCFLAEHILSMIKELGYRTEEGWGIHNGLFLASIKKSTKKAWEAWENKWGMEELWEKRTWKKVWSSLPHDVRELFEQIATEGIEFDDVYVCLRHGAWSFTQCPFCEDDELTLKFFPTTNIDIEDELNEPNPMSRVLRLLELAKDAKIRFIYPNTDKSPDIGILKAKIFADFLSGKDEAIV